MICKSKAHCQRQKSRDLFEDLHLKCIRSISWQIARILHNLNRNLDEKKKKARRTWHLQSFRVLFKQTETKRYGNFRCRWLTHRQKFNSDISEALRNRQNDFSLSFPSCYFYVGRHARWYATNSGISSRHWLPGQCFFFFFYEHEPFVCRLKMPLLYIFRSMVWNLWIDWYRGIIYTVRNIWLEWKLHNRRTAFLFKKPTPVCITTK